MNAKQRLGTKCGKTATFMWLVKKCPKQYIPKKRPNILQQKHQSYLIRTCAIALHLPIKNHHRFYQCAFYYGHYGIIELILETNEQKAPQKGNVFLDPSKQERPQQQ